MTFTAARDGAPVAVRWSVQEPAGGDITDSGEYRAPSAPGTFHVVATDTTNPALAATAAVTVTPSPVQVVVMPKSATAAAGGAVQFSATVSGTSPVSPRR